LMPVASLNPFNQLLDRLGLVAFWLEF